MNYPQAIEYLTTVATSVTRKGRLDAMRTYHEALGTPADKMKIVHITGTNGKGSVAAKVAHGLQLSGLRVGLFTSPHISSFRERIRINGELIEESDFARHVARVAALDNPTFFEVLTLAAFLYFAEQKVDIAVIEVGIGGALDSTNICTPTLSVITSIALDHQKYLGNTLESIARAKAGIIKENVPVVLGARAQLAPILQRAKEKNAPTICGIISGGFFDDENNEVASLALQSLSIPDAHICQAMRAMPRCRFEILTQLAGMARGFTHFPPYAVMDVAHNPDAMEHLFQAISLKLPSHPIRTVIGLTKGHDAKAILEVVKKHSAHVHPISTNNARVLPIEEFQDALEPLSSIEEAISLSAKNGEILLFCGTFYIMGGVRQALRFEEPRDPDTSLGCFQGGLQFGKERLSLFERG